MTKTTRAFRHWHHSWLGMPTTTKSDCPVCEVQCFLLELSTFLLESFSYCLCRTVFDCSHASTIRQTDIMGWYVVFIEQSSKSSINWGEIRFIRQPLISDHRRENESDISFGGHTNIYYILLLWCIYSKSAKYNSTFNAPELFFVRIRSTRLVSLPYISVRMAGSPPTERQDSIVQTMV